MFCIAVYDVNEKRVHKMLKLLRQYLNWIQNSVFEGNLSASQIEELKLKALDIIDPAEDSLIIYIMSSEKYIYKEMLGIDKSYLSSNLID
ncbi:MAG: CRISPR-associated endonuclease Cas2 [Ignavibacteria bacterium]|nr:CRISPR-associated endonuclease Cas2 [Ignavibacteria bacterium]